MGRDSQFRGCSDPNDREHDVSRCPLLSLGHSRLLCRVFRGLGNGRPHSRKARRNQAPRRVASHAAAAIALGALALWLNVWRGLAFIVLVPTTALAIAYRRDQRAATH
jgi:hypothetical protein